MLPFAKMNGAGNSILVVDERGRPPTVDAAAARRLAASDLHFDQMMVIGDPEAAGFDARVRIYNTDGSRAGACGNGTRCVASVMLAGREAHDLRLDVEGTAVLCRREAETRFTVDMGRPRFGWREVPLARPLDTMAADLGPVLAEHGLAPPVCLSMGNPHAVFFVADAGAVDLDGLGALLERDPAFPDRANISFATVAATDLSAATDSSVSVAATDRIALRVWERGVGVTLACGSAACATLVAAARRGLTGRHATVRLPGGELGILWREDDHVLMTGPVEVERTGVLTLADLAA